MKRVTDYIENEISKLPDSKYKCEFETYLINDLNQREMDIRHAGLDEDEIIEDLLISEHPDIKSEYHEIIRKAAKKRKRKAVFFTHVVSAFVYIITALVVFLCLSFETGKWSKTWVIIVDASIMLLAFIFLRLIVSLCKNTDFIVKQIPRVLIPLFIFLTATAIFLFLLIDLQITNAWVTYIFAVLIMFTVDGIYVQKTAERFAIFFHIIYIVPAFAMFYIILSALNIIPWSTGWIMIPLSLIIVIAVILIRLRIHSKSDKGLEVDDEWQEN